MTWTNSDREKFVLAIQGLAATFGREADAPMFMGYEMGLDDLSIPDIHRAVRRAIRECKCMPTVVELRELAGELSPRVRAVKAWGHLVRAIATHGGYNSVTFDDLVINATVRQLGGWQYLCGMNTDEFDRFLPKRFQDTYALLCQGGISREAAAPLVGIFDQENGLHCPAEVKQPRLVTTDMPPHRTGVVPALTAERAPLLALAANIGNMPADQPPRR